VDLEDILCNVQSNHFHLDGHGTLLPRLQQTAARRAESIPSGHTFLVDPLTGGLRLSGNNQAGAKTESVCILEISCLTIILDKKLAADLKTCASRTELFRPSLH
jgi:hypothetical protein